MCVCHSPSASTGTLGGLSIFADTDQGPLAVSRVTTPLCGALSALDRGDRVRRRDTGAFSPAAGSRFLGIAYLVLHNPRLRFDQSEMPFGKGRQQPHRGQPKKYAKVNFHSEYLTSVL